MLAHVDGSGRGHALVDHLQAVAECAGHFAEIFGSREWARLAGLWHDLGKYRVGFQKYIRQSSNPDAHIEGKIGGREKTHSAAGALWAIRHLAEKHGANGELAARVFAYLIASHHAGLYDWDGGLDQRLALEDSRAELDEALAAQPATIVLASGDFVPTLHKIPGGSDGFALWVRMLFSCLVDADFLDTEAFFEEGRPAARRGFPALSAMLEAFDGYMAEKAGAADFTPVNVLRADVLRQCRDKARITPGFFSLTVPTGGGKTLSSLAFALEHATRHNKRRIIYAIPYTSIIEQTADVFRNEVFRKLGDEVLIEHHSQADADARDETARSRLACENWDAPLIVTTNVQLFESLFAARTSRCRKLHNIVGSVIVLDEAQQLPAEFLQPVLDVLNLLVKHYGVTVVLCTATQPALSTSNYFDARRDLHGLENVREIIDDPESLHHKLKRVVVQLPSDWQTPMSWGDVAASLAKEDCVLCVVNTRRAARELYDLMPHGTLHLSALMCGAHRATVIQQIKDRLKARSAGTCHEPLRVVSTQLVEAGVDLDFPVVWRALAGLDSIAQAAGRCNREGKLNRAGRVVVFVPAEPPPLGFLRKGADACVSALRGNEDDPLALALFESYFRQLYHAVELDAKGICALLKVESATLAVQFRSASEAFRLIDDEDSAMVIVRYADGSSKLGDLLNTLVKEGPKRWLMRKLQRYSVSIERRVADKLLAQGGLTLSMPGLYVQQADTLYHEHLGFCTDEVPFNPSGHVL